MQCKSLRFTRHAVQRMFTRKLSAAAVTAIVEHGDVIEDYPSDFPYPSALLLGHDGSIPIHVAVARNPTSEECIVVTVYIPDPNRWSTDFKTRKSP